MTERQRLARDLDKRLTVRPNRKISLKRDYDSNFRAKGMDKEEAKTLLAEGVQKLAEYQEMLYAQDRYSLLIVLQALDAAGKDGAIKHVMSGLNPQGCQVYSFKAPTSEELDHDYLWRCAKALPERGRIGIFNRSYYEEVLVTKVHPEILEAQKLPHGSIDKKIYRRRYEEINNWEKYLVNNGTRILKVFLYVSKDEQKKRFLERIEMKEKNWKFSMADAKERTFWSKYIEAYEECISATCTEWAPWYVIPADHKPTSRLALAYLIYKELKAMDLAYPTVSKEHREQLAQIKTVLESEKE